MPKMWTLCIFIAKKKKVTTDKSGRKRVLCIPTFVYTLSLFYQIERHEQLYQLHLLIC